MEENMESGFFLYVYCTTQPMCKIQIITSLFYDPLHTLGLTMLSVHSQISFSYKKNIYSGQIKQSV